MTESEKEIISLVDRLNKYRDAYYNQNQSLISDVEYDALFDRLTELEEETGIKLPNSPTQSVGYATVSKLRKVKHNHPLLSLAKTTDLAKFQNYFGHKNVVLMAKMDGLTCSVEYRDGKLYSAETRGDGEVGEDILHSARFIQNLPKTIACKATLIVDGECIIDYASFDEVNDNERTEYKNPRNLVSGTVRQLDGTMCKKRNVKFIAWKLHSFDCEDPRYKMSDDFGNNLALLSAFAFEVVPYVKVQYYDNDSVFDEWVERIKAFCIAHDYPIDGIVGTFSDIKYGEGLGMTSHHPKHSLAFKFYQEDNETVLRDIEWNTTRTGLCNPVAVFDPVEIDGTTVCRATLSNVSIIEELELGIGDRIAVIKANQIIPQITKNFTRSNTYKPPKECPSCGQALTIENEAGRKTLHCYNIDCAAQRLDRLKKFVSREGMNIVGLSGEKLNALIDAGFITDYASLYEMEKYRAKIETLPGFGKSSTDSLLKAIDQSRNCKLQNFLTAIGIPLVGKATAKQIADAFPEEYYTAPKCDSYNVLVKYLFQLLRREPPIIGIAASKAVCKYFQDNESAMAAILEHLSIGKMEVPTMSCTVAGKTFCVTGSLEMFANRNALIEDIQKHGGAFTSSVSSKTDFLISNDQSSNSGKILKAKEYGVNIITENEYITMTSE